MDLQELLDAAKQYAAEHMPGNTPRLLHMKFWEGGEAKFLVPIAAASPAGKPTEPVVTEEAEAEPYVPFTPTSFQTRILNALNGKAMKTDVLGAAVGDRGRLYKPHGLRELQERGMVKLHSQLGHYRPDAPPPELTPE